LGVTINQLEGIYNWAVASHRVPKNGNFVRTKRWTVRLLLKEDEQDDADEAAGNGLRDDN
ncbi:hypothetical protein THAOC_25746, partial [Thalassiosira oceanica]